MRLLLLKFSLKWYPIHELSFLIFFLIPIIFLSFFYVRMILTIRKANSSNIRRSAYRGSNKKGIVSKPPDHRKQTIRMLGQYRKFKIPGVCKIHVQLVSWFFSLFLGAPSISSASHTCTLSLRTGFGKLTSTFSTFLVNNERDKFK